MLRAGHNSVEKRFFFFDGIDDVVAKSLDRESFSAAPPSPRRCRPFQAQGRGGTLLLDQHRDASGGAATGKGERLNLNSFGFPLFYP